MQKRQMQMALSEGDTKNDGRGEEQIKMQSPSKLQASETAGVLITSFVLQHVLAVSLRGCTALTFKQLPSTFPRRLGPTVEQYMPLLV